MKDNRAFILSEDKAEEFLNKPKNKPRMMIEEESKSIIEIPEGATNGDMLKALFPQWDLREEIGYEYKLFGETHKFEGLVDADWWNAPYKKESEDKE